MSDRVSALLLCKNSIIREGLSRILTERNFNILRSDDSSLNRSAYADDQRQSSPELILIDNGSEECDTASIAELKTLFPLANLVMLSDRFDFTVMLHAFRLGMRAYIVKEISCDRLVGTLRLVAMGERVLPSQLADELQSRPAFQAVPEIKASLNAARLSERERELLPWLIMGSPNKVISRQMEISEATVKVHIKAVLRKLDVRNRTQAAIWAVNHGMRGGAQDIPIASIRNVAHPSSSSATASAIGHLAAS